MSETPNTSTDESQVDESQKTFDLAYVTKLRQEAADYRTKAREHADAATELAQIKDAAKSDAEKQAERVAELEKANLVANAQVLKLRIAAKHGINDEDADLFLTGTDEESLNKQAERLASRVSDTKKPRGSHVPNEGKNPSPDGTGNPMRDVARNIFQPTV